MTQSRGMNRVLLLTAIVAVTSYGVGDLVSGLIYEGYSFRDQAISELTAFGSPVRYIMTPIMLLHGILLVVFGISLFLSAKSRALRGAGLMLSAANLVTLPTHTVWAMSSRGVQTGINDTLHAQTTIAFGLLVAGAIVLSAVATRGWFRTFSTLSLAVIIAFGLAASSAMTGLAEDNTPWAGAYERVNCYVYFLWLVLLALVATPARRRETSEAPSTAA